MILFDIVTKPKKAQHAHMYRGNKVFLLHVSANLADTFSEEHYSRWMYQDSTEFCEQIQRCKIKS